MGYAVISGGFYEGAMHNTYVGVFPPCGPSFMMRVAIPVPSLVQHCIPLHSFTCDVLQAVDFIEVFMFLQISCALVCYVIPHGLRHAIPYAIRTIPWAILRAGAPGRAVMIRVCARCARDNDPVCAFFIPASQWFNMSYQCI